MSRILVWFPTVLLIVRLKLRWEVGGAVLCCGLLLWLYNTVGVTKLSKFLYYFKEKVLEKKKMDWSLIKQIVVRDHSVIIPLLF